MNRMRKNASGRIKNAKRLLGYVRPLWYRYVIVDVCMVTSVALNAVMPLIIGRIVSEVILSGQTDGVRLKTLGFLLLCLALAGVCQAIANYFKEYLADMNGVIIGTRMRSDLFSHIQRLDLSFFDKNNTGELMARAKDDIDKVWFIMGFAGMFLCEMILHVAVTIYCMVTISPLLAVLPMLGMVCVIITATGMEKKLFVRYEELSEQNAELTAIAQENLAGVRTVKAFVREEYEIEKFKKSNDKYCDMNLELNSVLVKHQPIISFISQMMLVLVVIAGGVLVIDGGMQLGDLVAFAAYVENVIWPMEVLAWLSNEIAAGVASDRKIRKVLSARPEIVSPENAVGLERVKGRVTFDNVTFSIDGKDILENVSFDLLPGKTLGVMGVTGTGKSTIVNLIERFYDVSEGSVMLDGVDVRKLDLSLLRKSIAVVMQDVFLFSDSISENIRMGRRSALSEADLSDAAGLACAADFICNLNEQYDTIIGERGVGLSGGQKQRISIARALAKEAPVLVLDDATSALDTETEYSIQQALGNMSGTTKIIVAHRVSAVKDADEIIVLEDGRIAERGTHSELMGLRGRYFTTYVAQYNTEQDMVAV